MILTSIKVLSLIVVLTNAHYLNYHDAIGIPAAARIKETERRTILDFGINARIANGTEASVGTYPWMAGLVISLVGNSGTSVCGASLVSRNRLTTAGHCWVDLNGRDGPIAQASSFEVVLGSQYLFYGGLRIQTNNIVTHPKWGERNHFSEYDAAIIYLPHDVAFNENISPVNLPLDYIKESFVKYPAIAAGYGVLNDAQISLGVFENASIHQVNLTVISNDECNSYYKQYVPPTCICTSGFNGVGVCPGDSGGPLVTYVNDVPILIGIVAEYPLDGCEIGKPSVYTRVTIRKEA